MKHRGGCASSWSDQLVQFFSFPRACTTILLIDKFSASDYLEKCSSNVAVLAPAGKAVIPRRNAPLSQVKHDGDAFGWSVLSDVCATHSNKNHCFMLRKAKGEPRVKWIVQQSRNNTNGIQDPLMPFGTTRLRKYIWR